MKTIAYWEDRYARGGDSGYGSYGDWAIFKAKIINKFIAEHNVKQVIEWGCGDGNQLNYMEYECYCGYDVSKTAIESCEKMFQRDRSKRFKLYGGECLSPFIQKWDLSLSLDVIYHLLEDNLFFSYMMNLFDSSSRYVVIYSIDSDNMLKYMQDMGNTSEAFPEHMRLWKFSQYVSERFTDWRLINVVYPDKALGTSFTNFYFYERVV